MSVIDSSTRLSPAAYDAFAPDPAIPIASPPCASIDVRFMSPIDSGSIAFRSAAGIGAALPLPVTAPRMSPIALPAAALSPDCCADSIRLPASSMRLAMSAMPEGLMVTVAPSGVLIWMSPPPAAPGSVGPPTVDVPNPIGPLLMKSDDTAPRTIIAMMVQTTTTAV